MALKPRYLVALATALAFGLARYQLGYESFWIDEFTTRTWALLPFAEIWPRADRGYHAPLYFWFMHVWLKVVPASDEVWLRLPSAFFFAGTVPMVYLVGRALGGARAGVYAAFLAATCPFLLHYGQEARSYAMVTFFAACGFAAAARIMCRWRDEARPRLPGAGLVDACGWLARGHWRESGLCRGRSCDPRTPGWALRDDGAWGAYIVSSVVVMMLHYTAGLFPVVTGLILLCALWTAPSFRGVRFASLCIAMAAIAVLWSPWIPYLLSGVGRISLFYLEVPSAHQILSMLRKVYGGGFLPMILLTLFALSAIVAWAWSRRWERVAFALLGWLLAPMFFIAFSFWKPIVQGQLMIWTLVPFLAACGAGLALVPWTLVRAGALALLLGWNTGGVEREWEIVKQDWKGVPRIVPRTISPDATVLICPRWDQYIFNWYWEREGRESVKLHFIDVLGGRQKIFEAVGSWGPEVELAELSAQHPEIWLIWGGICRKDVDSITRALEEKGPLLRAGTIRIRLYGEKE